MSLIKFLSTSLCLILLLCQEGQATVLTFDGLQVFDGDYQYWNHPITEGYGGFHWNNITYMAGSSSGGGGYTYGIVTFPNVAVTLSWLPEISITRDELFTFNGAYMTAGPYSSFPFIIEVKGFRNDLILFEKTVTLPINSVGPDQYSFGPYWINYNFENIDKLTFKSYFDYNEPFSWTNGPLVMDNFTFNEPTSNPVPEPTTMLLLGSGLIGLVGLRRKIKNQF